MNSKIEKRVSCELRLSSDSKKIIGYAAVYNRASEDLGGFIEYVRPGAFDRSLKSNPDVRALIDHDPSLILGRTLSGTLILESDTTGLKVTIDPPPTSYASDLLTVMQRGDVSQMSFAFTSAVDDWKLVDGQRTRDLIDLDLVDVSVVTYPAYPDTSVAVRALVGMQSEKDLKKLQEELAANRARALRLRRL
jgi:HK97 family phage prohead protease